MRRAVQYNRLEIVRFLVNEKGADINVKYDTVCVLLCVCVCVYVSESVSESECVCVCVVFDEG